MRPIVSLTRRYNAQIAKSHRFDGSRSRADIARMSRFAKDEAHAAGEFRNGLH